MLASRTILPGQIVAVFGGTPRRRHELRLLRLQGHSREDLRRSVLQVDEDRYLVSLLDSPADWINHSCQPNVGMRGRTILVAMRVIEAEEEICFDYAMTDGSNYDEFDCTCGAPNCRGRITGEDWALPELRDAYRGYFSEYLQRRIDRLPPPTEARPAPRVAVRALR